MMRPRIDKTESWERWLVRTPVWRGQRRSVHTYLPSPLTHPLNRAHTKYVPLLHFSFVTLDNKYIYIAGLRCHNVGGHDPLWPYRTYWGIKRLQSSSFGKRDDSGSSISFWFWSTTGLVCCNSASSLIMDRMIILTSYITLPRKRRIRTSSMRQTRLSYATIRNM